MKRAKQKELAARGWRVGTAAEFLGLTPEEAAFVEIKLALSDAVRSQRQTAKLRRRRPGSSAPASPASPRWRPTIRRSPSIS